jgi:hypothetical protein
MTDENWDRPVPEAAFSLLGHEVRLDVLRAFFERHEPVDPDSLDEVKTDRHLSYSELMDAVDMRDSGKFNYHLEKLRGVYVEKVGDEYAPTASAVALYRAVVANRPTESISEGFDVEANCPNCEAPMQSRYEQEYLTVECTECTAVWGITYGFPKNGVVVRPDDDVFEALYDRLMYHVGLARTGQCPSCAGVTEVTVPRDRLDGERVPTAEMTCGTCSWLATVDVASALQFDPRVASALAELGAAPVETEGEIPTAVTGRVRSESPFRATVDLETDGGGATVVVDGDLDVCNVEVRGSPGDR